MTLMSLGLFAFSIDTLAYSELQRRSEWRHARSSRFGTRDATQFVGVGEETILLPGIAYSELMDGEASIDKLRAMADQGETWPLVCASGRVYGNYVITGIEDRHTSFWPDGSPRAIEFGINLLRVDDPAQAAS